MRLSSVGPKIVALSCGDVPAIVRAAAARSAGVMSWPGWLARSRVRQTLVASVSPFFAPARDGGELRASASTTTSDFTWRLRSLSCVR